MGFEMIIMMFDEEQLNLFCEKRKQLFGRLCLHKRPRNGDLGLLKRECLISMQHDTADTKIRSSQIHGEINALKTM